MTTQQTITKAMPPTMWGMTHEQILAKLKRLDELERELAERELFGDAYSALQAERSGHGSYLYRAKQTTDGEAK